MPSEIPTSLFSLLGLNSFCISTFLNMRINMLMSRKQHWNNSEIFSELFQCFISVVRAWLNIKAAAVYNAVG